MSSHPRLGLPLYAAIGLAAALGGSIRYAVSIAWLEFAGTGWPWPTLIVNVVGSFLIAMYWRLTGPEARFTAFMARRTAVMTGFCGGLTTFSMFGVETLNLLDQGRGFSAASYVTLSGIGALGAALIGLQDFRQGNAGKQ